MSIDVISMTWCISDMESGLNAIFLPTQAESLVITTLNVFWHITTTHSSLLLNFLLYLIDVRGKISDIESLSTFSKVSVCDKANADSQALVLTLHMIDNLMQSVLRPLNPTAH